VNDQPKRSDDRVGPSGEPRAVEGLCKTAWILNGCGPRRTATDSTAAGQVVIFAAAAARSREPMDDQCL
jgi:hypothetical protein